MVADADEEVDDQGFVLGAPEAGALSMLSARLCLSGLCVFIRLPEAFALELAALLGLRLAVLG